MFCGASAGLPLEWNGLRVLTRIGYGRAEKDYGKSYRSVQEALQGELPRKAEDLACAHLLLRRHGKEVCRNNAPLCRSCPVAGVCGYPMKQVRCSLVQLDNPYHLFPVLDFSCGLCCVRIEAPIPMRSRSRYQAVWPLPSTPPADVKGRCLG